jgi:hypothetical protein
MALKWNSLIIPSNVWWKQDFQHFPNMADTNLSTSHAPEDNYSPTTNHAPYTHIPVRNSEFYVL